MTKVTRARSAAAPPAIIAGLQAIPYFAPLPAGALAALGRGSGPHLPALALAQARMLTDLSAAGGAPSPSDTRAAAETVGPLLAAALATGLAARTLVRRSPVGGRLVGGLVAAGATVALASLAGRIGSVRSGT